MPCSQVEIEGKTLSAKLCAVKAKALIDWVSYPQPKAKKLCDTWEM